MALTNITTDHTQSATLTFNIPVASGGRRKLLVLVSQNRTPANITGVTVESVTGTTFVTKTEAGGNRRVIGVEFADAILPAATGNATIRTLPTGHGTGCALTAFFCASANQNALTLFGSMASDGDNSATLSLSFSGTTGSIIVGHAIAGNALSATTIHTVIMPSTVKGSFDSASMYGTGQYLQYALTSAEYTFAAGVVEPHYDGGSTLTITLVGGDNEVYSAEADFEVKGTGFSLGQTFTIAGVACTELSLSGSTSIKLTAPNAISNNIRFGKREFKVTD